MKQYIIIHYGEIYLKGGNRKFFEDKLIRNIEAALQDLGNIWLRHIAGRIIVLIEDNWDLEDIKQKLQKVFGIEYFTFAWKTTQDIKQIEKDLYSLIKDKEFTSFRITTRRTNKKFPVHSQDMDIKLGDLVVKKMKKKVNLENPDLNCHLDIFRDYAFIYFDKFECRGGLPVGVSGKLLCLLSGGIDSPVAANLMQKRGSEIVFVNFDAYPATPKENQEKVEDLTKVLNKYQEKSKLYIVPFLDIQKEIIRKVPEDYRVVFYRRMMLRIAKQIAVQENILALVTGESLGQVASQTVENIRVISEAIDLPILRPCIGLNKEEITNLAKEINTYDISSQPFDDCCSLYVPKHPVTHSDLDLVLDTEKDWKYDNLLDQAVVDAGIINIK
ncbi:tRNA uracil 4-sulfurtransferase ThiI [Patescibacteria group bacterium]